MPDFTSALYLGFRHPSSSLPPWRQLTSGVPAALRESTPSVDVAASLARLTGARRALLAPSTLHVFWDLFAALADGRSAILVDAHAYPIARWGAERVAARGVPVASFAAHEPDALAEAIRRSGRRPLVLADGYCAGCGPTPLAAYAEIARAFGGVLVVDDTQPLGVLGAHGGGSLTFPELDTRGVVAGASLAKGFGVPVAVLAGDPRLVDRYEQLSETRVHCSPPSAADVNAVEHALAVNARSGDGLRARLAATVRAFRRRAKAAGLAPRGGMFPVQTLAVADAPALHERLGRHDVRTVLVRGKRGSPEVAFVLTAEHTDDDLDRAFALLAPRALAAA